MPTVTESKSGSSCDRTRMPLARRVLRMRLALRLFALGLLERLLVREADLARLVDLEHLHEGAAVQHLAQAAGVPARHRALGGHRVAAVPRPLHRAAVGTRDVPRA